jgi:hypothetical protein
MIVKDHTVFPILIGNKMCLWQATHRFELKFSMGFVDNEKNNSVTISDQFVSFLLVRRRLQYAMDTSCAVGGIIGWAAADDNRPGARTECL